TAPAGRRPGWGLAGERLRRMVPEWKGGQRLVLRPGHLRPCAAQGPARHGLNPADFHQEPGTLKRPPAETKKPLETGAFGAKTWRKRRDSNSGGCYTRRFSRPLP